MSIQLENIKKAHKLLKFHTDAGTAGTHGKRLVHIRDTELRAFVAQCYTKGGEG